MKSAAAAPKSKVNAAAFPREILVSIRTKKMGPAAKLKLKPKGMAYKNSKAILLLQRGTLILQWYLTADLPGFLTHRFPDSFALSRPAGICFRPQS